MFGVVVDLFLRINQFIFVSLQHVDIDKLVFDLTPLLLSSVSSCSSLNKTQSFRGILQNNSTVDLRCVQTCKKYENSYHDFTGCGSNLFCELHCQQKYEDTTLVSHFYLVLRLIMICSGKQKLKPANEIMYPFMQ